LTNLRQLKGFGCILGCSAEPGAARAQMAGAERAQAGMNAVVRGIVAENG